ncbi:MAG TPA: RNA pyrophosphohydrolase [Magnetospirillaceae bacterium]|nr:RNA pyrophosphohydrolase [Magnetospirillaceae bacterium]
MSTLPYRLGVGLVLFNAEGLVWAGRRLDQKIEAWQMPQGGIDEGETPEQAALRELEEEIGTGKAEIIAESKDWLTYELPPELVGVAWKGRYRGQKQKWFALRFTGEDADIRIDTEHPEFEDWRWVDFDQLVELIVPFKRALYEQITAEFSDLAKTLRS